MCVRSRVFSLSLSLLVLSPCGMNLEGQSVELRKGELGELLRETQTWELCGLPGTVTLVVTMFLSGNVPLLAPPSPHSHTADQLLARN